MAFRMRNLVNSYVSIYFLELIPEVEDVRYENLLLQKYVSFDG